MPSKQVSPPPTTSDFDERFMPLQIPHQIVNYELLLRSPNILYHRRITAAKIIENNIFYNCFFQNLDNPQNEKICTIFLQIQL